MSPRIVVAPLSNDPLRDWPLAHFRELAELCVEKLDATVEFVGTRPQRLAVNEAIRALSSDRFINRCGKLSWSETSALIRSAACVVANNSGIAHLAAEWAVPAVSIFCGSHSPLEWMARGPGVVVITRRTVCSPCALGRITECPYDRRCFTSINAATVFRQVQQLVSAPTHLRQPAD